MNEILTSDILYSGINSKMCVIVSNVAEISF